MSGKKASSSETAGGRNESQRDHYRTNVTRILLGNLSELSSWITNRSNESMTENLDQDEFHHPPLKRMPWKNWREVAIKTKVVMVNWPENCSPLGLSFDIRDMSLSWYEGIFGHSTIEKTLAVQMKIQSWSQGGFYWIHFFQRCSLHFR
jgi:hypothetical protein